MKESALLSAAKAVLHERFDAGLAWNDMVPKVNLDALKTAVDAADFWTIRPDEPEGFAGHYPAAIGEGGE